MLDGSATDWTSLFSGRMERCSARYCSDALDICLHPGLVTRSLAVSLFGLFSPSLLREPPPHGFLVGFHDVDNIHSEMRKINNSFHVGNQIVFRW